MKSDATRGDRRPFLGLMTANTVSQIGNMMTAVAVPWFVLETSGSAAQVGLVSASIAIGAVLPAILGGPLVDRIGLRRASVSADVLSSITVLLIPTLHLAGVLEFWMLPILAFVLASVNAQGDTGRLALLPILAREAAVAPERANAVDRAAARSGQLVGPVLAGVLIAFIGPSNVLFVNVATFVTSAVLVLFSVPPSIERRDIELRQPSGQRYGADLAEGLRFVLSNRLVLGMVLLATVGNLLDVPLLQVVLPVYASEVFGSPTALGLLMGSFAGGALLGTIAFGVIGSRMPRRRTFLGSWLLLAVVVYGGLVLQPPLPVLVVVGLTGGLLSGPINPIILTVVQAETPPQLLGRVFGALTAVAQAGIPFGAAIIGLVIEGAGLIETIAGMGVLYVLTLTVMFTIPALRRMDAVSPAAAATVEPPTEAAPTPQARACATMKAGL